MDFWQKFNKQARDAALRKTSKRKLNKPSKPRAKKSKPVEKSKYVDDECQDEEYVEDSIDITQSDNEDETEGNEYDFDDGFTVDDITTPGKLGYEEEEQKQPDKEEEEDEYCKRKRLKREEKKEEYKQQIMAEMKKMQEVPIVKRVRVGIFGPSSAAQILDQAKQVTEAKITESIRLAYDHMIKEWKLTPDRIDLVSGGLGSADFVATRWCTMPALAFASFSCWLPCTLSEDRARVIDSGTGDLTRNAGRLFSLSFAHLSQTIKCGRGITIINKLLTQEKTTIQCFSSMEERNQQVLETCDYCILFLNKSESDPLLQCKNVQVFHVFSKQ